MDKTNTWLIRVFAVVLVFVCLIAYLNAQANSSLLRPTIEDLQLLEELLLKMKKWRYESWIKLTLG